MARLDATIRAMKRVLILGGTGEARELASLAGRAGFTVVTSLAGVTANPALPDAGAVRVGGFGGVEGLRSYLAVGGIDLLVDATHPFADQISANAAAAAAAAGVPRLLLSRPEWAERPGDSWVRVETIEEAVVRLPEVGRRVFLTIGRQELAAFAQLRELWFLYRMIGAPEAGSDCPPGLLHLAQGPFAEADELELMRAHAIDVLVTRNSGGMATYGKIGAARKLSVPVVVIGRPALPESERVESAAEALHWLLRRPS